MQIEPEDVVCRDEAVPLVEALAPRRRPEDHGVDLAHPAFADGLVEKRGADAATAQAGQDVEVRDVAVPFRLTDGVDDLLEQVQPDVSDDPLRLDGEPAAPERALVEPLPHPALAAGEEFRLALGGRAV